MYILKEGISHYLTSTMIAKLKKLGIKTTVQFLSQDLETLSRNSSTPYKILTNIRKSLVKRTFNKVKNGAEIYDGMITHSCIFTTGSSNLDNFLEGGIFSGEVTELAGPSSSGKSQLCFSIITRLLSETNKSLLYIDTGSNFSASRVSQMLLHMSCKESNMELMKRVHHCTVYNAYELIEIISDIKVITKTCGKQLGVIMIDSITPIIYPLLGQKQLEGMGLLVQVSQKLNCVAKENMLAVIVCNRVVQTENGETRPALGKYWWSVPSVSLLLKTDTKSINLDKDIGCAYLGNKRIICIGKNGRSRAGKSLNFEICNEGISVKSEVY